MSELSAADRLAELDVAVEEASARVKLARHRREREYGVSADATADLTAYRDGVQYRRREPDVDEQRRLTQELFDRVTANGYVLEAVGGGAGVLIVRDPAVMRELEEATEALSEIKRERRAFAAEHADEIDAERRAADAQAIRDAIAGDDPDAVREALAAP